MVSKIYKSRQHYYVSVLLIVLAVVLFNSCNQTKVKNSPNVSAITVDDTIIRYEKIMFNPDTAQRNADLLTHPELANIVLGYILRMQVDNKRLLSLQLDTLTANEASSNIYKLADSTFANFSSIQSDWTKSLQYYKHYFPESGLPRLYTLQSNLGIANFVFENKSRENSVAASLDFFLGKAYPYKGLAQDNPAFSDYNNRTFNRDHLVSKSMNAIVDDMLGEESNIRMLSFMIREGKRLYILEKLCPHLPDSVIFEYSQEDLNWCSQNEQSIWTFFIEGELLYESELQKIMKYIKPAPTSSGMPKEAPGKTGNFIGYKIVEAYMNKYPETSLSSLLLNKDAQSLFNLSKYKPKRR